MPKDIYEQVTQRIIDQLEKGVCPWRRPWSTHSVPPQNFVSQRPYSGMNFFLLSSAGFSSPYFMTFRQVNERGGRVIKGSQGFPITYWDTMKVEPKAGENPDESRVIPFLRAYTVFNAEQIDGIDFPTIAPEPVAPFEQIERAQQLVSDWKDCPKIQHGGNRACYVITDDLIRMPHKEQFAGSPEYYSTLFHEMGHSTGASTRLNRKIENHFGGRDYSREELVAEMTSAFLCAQCGIDNNVIENQSAYLHSWMKSFRNDPKMLIWAAGQAQRASKLISGIDSEQRLPSLSERQQTKEFAQTLVTELVSSMRLPQQPEIEMG